jgi:hypothetical protein
MLHEKPTLVAHWLACAGSVKMMMLLMMMNQPCSGYHHQQQQETPLIMSAFVENTIA